MVLAKKKHWKKKTEERQQVLCAVHAGNFVGDEIGRTCLSTQKKIVGNANRLIEKAATFNAGLSARHVADKIFCQANIGPICGPIFSPTNQQVWTVH